MIDTERAEILLKATKAILTKCNESVQLLDVMHQTAIWDGVECDSGCLLEEITELLSD